MKQEKVLIEAVTISTCGQAGTPDIYGFGHAGSSPGPKPKSWSSPDNSSSPQKIEFRQRDFAGHGTFLRRGVCSLLLLGSILLTRHAFSQGQPKGEDDGLVRAALLSPHMMDALTATGDRLVQPGKERVILVGTLNRLDGSPPVPTRLLLELPRRMRLETQEGGQVKVRIFKNSQVIKTAGQTDQVDRELVDLLVFSFPDSFFFGRMEGAPTQFLGCRFLVENDDSGEPGPKYFDIYQVYNRYKIGKSQYAFSKLFCFDSDSLLLERVRYRSNRDGTPINVEVRFANWMDIGGQSLPGSITRREQGLETLVLNFSSAQVGPKQNDNSFDVP